MSTGNAHEGLSHYQMQARATLCRWQVVAASIRGTSHEKTGQPCQDAHRWDILPGDTLAVAVADGAGSAVLGEVGATIAAQVAADTLRLHKAGLPWPASDEAWQVLLTDALKAARGAIEAEARDRAVPIRDFATTLILMVATPALVATAQVGDGAAVVGDEAGNIIALTTPQSGEYLNETTFLTSSEALHTAQVHVWRGAPVHVAAFSDGLQMLALKMPEGMPHAPFFTPLFRFVAETNDSTAAQEQLVAFLRSPRVRERADDDLTLLIAIRRPSQSSLG